MPGENESYSGAVRGGLGDGWLVLGLGVMFFVAGEGREISPLKWYGWLSMDWLALFNWNDSWKPNAFDYPSENERLDVSLDATFHPRLSPLLSLGIFVHSALNNLFILLLNIRLRNPRQKPAHKPRHEEASNRNNRYVSSCRNKRPREHIEYERVQDDVDEYWRRVLHQICIRGIIVRRSRDAQK